MRWHEHPGQAASDYLASHILLFTEDFFNSFENYSDRVSTFLGTIAPNAALNVVPTPRAWSGELAHPGLEPAGAG